MAMFNEQVSFGAQKEKFHFFSFVTPHASYFCLNK
jgi:hypothetical protein